MQIHIQSDFDRFLMAVLTGKEFEIYSVQRDELILAPPAQGEHDMVIETKKRFLRYTIVCFTRVESDFLSGGLHRTKV